MYDRLLVGCPLFDRAWIIGKWFDHVEEACANLGVAPSYIFIGDPLDKSVLLARDCAADYDRTFHLVEEEENLDVSYKRRWTENRLRRMVDLRNALLTRVRELQPAYFLSLDSDILLHRHSLVNMMETVYRYDAVGGKAYMSSPPGLSCPSYGMQDGKIQITRVDSNNVMDVDVIMAVKLMTTKAYEIDYRYEYEGEDIGWSMACREAGLTLGWDGRVCNKHIMNPTQVNVWDERVGF